MFERTKPTIEIGSTKGILKISGKYESRTHFLPERLFVVVFFDLDVTFKIRVYIPPTEHSFADIADARP